MITDEEELKNKIRPNNSSVKPALSKQFNYLFECYQRLHKYKKELDQADTNLFEYISNLIINMCRTLLTIFDDFTQVNLINTSIIDHNYYSDQNAIKSNDLCIQLIYLIIKCLNSEINFENSDCFKMIEKFYDSFINLFEKSEILSEFFSNSTLDLEQIFDKTELTFLTRLFEYFNKYFISINQCEDYSNDFVKCLELIKFLTRSKLMKYIFVLNSFPSSNSSPGSATSTVGRTWQVNTLIGKLLTPHCLPLYKPKNLQTMEYKYFKNPAQLTKRDVDLAEQSISQAQKLIKSELKAFFYDHLIKQNSNARIRNLWLKWTGDCLSDNSKKSQEWNNYSQSAMHSLFNNSSHVQFASDGFLLNLLELFLEYSMPFCNDPYSSKLLKINCNYSTQSRQNFYGGCAKETSLIPADDSRIVIG
jgi:hypothetical protein